MHRHALTKPPRRALAALGLVLFGALACTGTASGPSGNATAQAGASQSSGSAGSSGSQAAGGPTAGGAKAGGQSTGGAATAGGSSAGGSAGSSSGGAPSDPTTADDLLHFVVYGDSRTNVADHQSVVDAFAEASPELVLATGDLWDGYGPDTYRSIITKNANIAELLNQNLFLVSRGNHETVAEALAFTPTLVRNSQERYSFMFKNSFFVSMGMDPAADSAFLAQELGSSAAQAAKWRFVYSHYPIYSAGPHGGAGNATIEGLCDQHHVTIYFSGHDHLYERSHQMHGQQVADNDDALSAAAGTVFIVTGGGGAPLYATGSIPSTHYTISTRHYVDVDAGSDLVSVAAIEGASGNMLDSFEIGP